MKKLIALVLALVCVLGMVGCNNSETVEKNSNSTINVASTQKVEVIVPDKSNDDNPLFNETDITAVTTTNDNILETFGDIQYTCDLSVFPTEGIRNWFGEIILIENDRLLISPGYEGKEEFGEVVWLICEEAFAYGIGQVVTFTFRDIKAPDKEGEPLNIIALSVYME